MSKSVLLAAAAALVFTACGDETPGIAGESGETMSTVSALVVAPVGPNDTEAEFIVDVHHDPRLDPEVAERLIENVRVVRIPQIETDKTVDNFDPERAFQPDVYWHEGEPFEVHVEVDAVDDKLRDELYIFEWIDAAALFEHCPEGSHPFM